MKISVQSGGVEDLVGVEKGYETAVEIPLGYALQNEMLGGTTAKQKVYDNLLKEGITPSEVIEKTVSDKTKKYYL